MLWKIIHHQYLHYIFTYKSVYSSNNSYIVSWWNSQNRTRTLFEIDHDGWDRVRFRMTNVYAASYWHTLFRYICMYTFNVYTIKCTINFYTINVYTIKNMINVCTLNYMINVYMMKYKVILNAINYTIKVNAIKDMIFVDLLLYNHKMINSSTIWISSLLHGIL